MRPREIALRAPPARPPYLTVKVNGEPFVLRAPSLQRMGALLQLLSDSQRAGFFSLPELVAEGSPIFAALAHLPEQFPLLAAAVGLCWADPLHELETPPWKEGDDLVAYGAAVYEELHEQGWSLNHIAGAVLVVADHLRQENQLLQSVVERTTFFRLPRADSSESDSPSSADSSGASTASVSTS